MARQPPRPLNGHTNATALPMKVVHIITQLELGGAQQNTLYTVTHLDPTQFETSLIAGPGGLLQAEACAMLKERLVSVPSLIRTLNPWQDLLALIQLWRLLRRIQPVIVHTHAPKAGILGRWAAWLARVPLIVHTFHHGFGPERFPSGWRGSCFISIERWTAKIAVALIVVSKESQRAAQALGIGQPAQYVLIRSGIVRTAFRPVTSLQVPLKSQLGVPQDVPIVTMVASLKDPKNPVDFVEVAALVHREMPNVHWLLVGDGELRHPVEERVDQRGLGDRIRLLGWRRDVAALLGITDLFVLTSLSEGLPRAMLEAMAAGIPIVANAIDGIKDIIRDGVNGVLCEPRNVRGMADHILHLLRNRPFAERLGQAGQGSLSEEFDIDVMVRQQEALYRSLVTSGNR